MSSSDTIGDRTRTHGMSNTRLYNTWCGIKDRCNNKNTEHYDRYGGRGISVCTEWQHSFQSFMKWSFSNGYRNDSTGKEQSIDRIDVNGNYCPENCRWVSKTEQARNRTDTVYIEYKNEKIPARKFAEDNGIDYVFVFRRVKKKQHGEDIICDWNMIHHTPEYFMNVKEAANVYEVSTESIIKWIKEKKLKAEKHGCQYFILRNQVVKRSADRDKNGRFISGKKK